MSEDSPQKNHGILDGQKHIATYTDPDGEVTRLSSYCTHEHCDVDWDDQDKNWHCICHGARFKGTGEVIKGPATKELRKLKDHE